MIAPRGTFVDPASVELGRAWVDGQPGTRLMVILRAPGCRYARRPGGGCTNCGFEHLTTCGRLVAREDLLEQLVRALAMRDRSVDCVRQLDLFCSGSFFCDEEVQPEARPLLIAEVASRLPAMRRLMLESRPEYVSSTALRAACAALTGAGSDARIEVGIGLESADDTIRQERVNKGFTLQAFERAAERVAAAGCALVVYLLLKPRGTGEGEAVRDVVSSAEYLQRLGQRLSVSLRVALEPAFVPEGTPLHRDLLAGRYSPPTLWSVVAAVRQIHRTGLAIHVGLSDEGLPVDHAPAGCPRCSGEVRAALARFNETQQVGSLDEVDCDCRPASG